jgi:hypothetical protein
LIFFQFCSISFTNGKERMRLSLISEMRYGGCSNFNAFKGKFIQGCDVNNQP